MNRKKIAEELVRIAERIKKGKAKFDSPKKVRDNIADDLRDIADVIETFYIDDVEYEFTSEDGGQHRKAVDNALSKLRKMVDKMKHDVDYIKKQENTWTW